jgi:hypothetical protein
MTPAQVNALLSALSAECAEMGGAADGLATVVFEHARGLPAAERGPVVVQAQAIDLLVQKLAAIADLAGALSEGRPVDAAIDALPLADLAARLRAAVLGGPAGPAPSDSGDLLLFD